jgi:hypothetical protein
VPPAPVYDIIASTASYRASRSVVGEASEPVTPPITPSVVVQEHWWTVGIRGLQYSP